MQDADCHNIEGIILTGERCSDGMVDEEEKGKTDSSANMRETQ